MTEPAPHVGFLARLGLAVVRPQAALAVAGDREHAGRSGQDLLLALVVMLVVTQARGLVSAVWLGAAVDATLGLRAVVSSLTNGLAVILGFLVVSALAIWLAAGPRRDLGRASDLACVAVLPLVFVDLLATLVLLAAGLDVPRIAMTAISLVAYMWAGALVMLAVLEARRVGRAAPPPAPDVPLGKKAGWALVAVTLAGVVLQTVWVVRYLDRMRPVMSGDPAPGFTLPRIAAKGALGEPLSLESLRGKIVIVDFWATWCGPCVKAMPHLDRFQRKHPDDVAVITINIDEPSEARAMFDEAGYALTLLAGDADTSDRYDVGAIPHTVVIDRQGMVRKVVRGGKIDLEREISAL